jgi:GT2 family glycosyltransferase
VINVIILSKTDEYLLRCLESLVSTQSPFFPGARIVIGDNGLSRRGSSRYIDVYQACRIRNIEILSVPIPSPFVFARAVNLCVETTERKTDLFLLNDDTTFESENPLSTLTALVEQEREAKIIGMLSPQITGGCGNTDQTLPVELGKIRLSDLTLCFIAVVIFRDVWDTVGPLDERFTGYGFEDADYSRRVRAAGYELGVTSAVVIRHHGYSDELPMHGTFAREYSPELMSAKFEEGKRIFEAKWGDLRGAPA